MLTFNFIPSQCFKISWPNNVLGMELRSFSYYINRSIAKVPRGLRTKKNVKNIDILLAVSLFYLEKGQD